MTYYHVVAPLEDKFTSLNEAVNYFKGGTVDPYIPKHVAPGEDTSTPRICVASSIADCLTAIGIMGTFRRCLAANDDAYDCRTDGLEVYPILICEFRNVDVYTPTEDEVPDVALTGERWILEPTEPSSVVLRWLSPLSIRWSKSALSFNSNWVCKSVEFVEPSRLSKHPWLNGFGTELDSSMEEPPWREADADSYRIAYEDEDGVHLVSDRVYASGEEAFDDWVEMCKLTPRRYIVPDWICNSPVKSTGEMKFQERTRINKMNLG